MSKRSYFYRNGLSIVFLTLFIVTLAAQALTGWKEHNKDLAEAHVPILSLLAYLGTGHLYRQLLKTSKVSFCKCPFMWC